MPVVVPHEKVFSIDDEWIRYQSDAPEPSSTSENMPSTSHNSEIKENDDSPSQRIDTYWSKIFSEKDASGNNKYKHLPVLVKALLALTHWNADCERGFSENV